MKNVVGACVVLGGFFFLTLTAHAQCPTPRSTPSGPSLWISDQTVSPGSSTATISVSLATGGAQIAGTQCDITFPAEGALARRADGKVDCTVNPAINKDATGFLFYPHSDCNGGWCLRVLVIATDNNDPIPDGSMLFTCNVDLAPGFLGTLDYILEGIILSDPFGGKVLPASNQDGTLCIPGGPTSTPQPTATLAPYPTAPPSWTPGESQGSPGLLMSNETLSPGTTTAALTTSLATGDRQIAGVQADVTFPIEGSIAVNANGKPDCTVNPAINKGATSFVFRPNGCAGTGCSIVRVLVLAIDNTDPIPGGSVLFSCNISVAPGFIGTLNYTLLGVILSDPNGGKVLPVNEQDGTVSIPGGPTSTRQPTPTTASSPTPEPTWTPRPTFTPQSTWTPSPTWTPTLTGYCGMTAGTCTPTPTNTPVYVPVFTCNVSSPSSSGEFLYDLSDVILSDPAGNVVKDAGDQDGQICTDAVCPSPRPAPVASALWIPDQALDAGTTLPMITVELVTDDTYVAGLQCDISYPANAPIAAKANGRPDCTVNPYIYKDATSFAFHPPGCSGAQCTSVRALVLATDNTDPIFPNGPPKTFTGTPGPTGTPTRVGFCGSTNATCTPVPLRAPGDPCTTDAQCDPSLAPFCTDGMCCFDRICPPDNRCDIPGNSGVCSPTSDVGGSCVKNTQCNPLLICDPVTQTCTVPLATPTFNAPTFTPVGGAPSTTTSTTTSEEGCQIPATSEQRGDVLWLSAVAGLVVLRRRKNRRGS